MDTKNCTFFAVNGGKLHSIKKGNIAPYILTSCGMILHLSIGTIIKAENPVHNKPCKRCFKEYEHN